MQGWRMWGGHGGNSAARKNLCAGRHGLWGCDRAAIVRAHACAFVRDCDAGSTANNYPNGSERRHSFADGYVDDHTLAQRPTLPVGDG